MNAATGGGLMKAVLCTEFIGPDGLVVGEVDAPKVGPGQVRVAVHAATVTYMDTLIVSGLYQLKPPLPFVAGTDAAGEVIEIGEGVTHFKRGDRVATFNWTGAFAEEMVAAENRTVRLPDGVDYHVGTTILHNYITGLYSLQKRAALQSGETLVVHGAAGGVGLAAVDLGRHMGARVIGSVGSKEKVDLVRQYGAEAVIDYSKESVKDRVRELTGGLGADVIFDTVGGDVFDQSLRCINWGGRLLVIGFTSGRIPQAPANLPLLKNCSIVGVFTGAWADRFPEEHRAVSDTVMDWVAKSHLKPLVSRVMPLEQVGAAMRAIANREVTGRIVLNVR